MSATALPHQEPEPSLADAFVRRHQVGLWRWLRVLGCTADRAEEHCQDAFLAALHLGVDRWAAGAASAWLRTAAKNLFLMQLRAERRRPRWTSLDDVEASWTAAGGEADGGDAALRALDECLRALPPRDHDLVMRRYRDREPRAVTAQQLGIGEAGVKQALRRARERLRICLGIRIRPTTHP